MMMILSCKTPEKTRWIKQEWKRNRWKERFEILKQYIKKNKIKHTPEKFSKRRPFTNERKRDRIYYMFETNKVIKKYET